MPEYGSGGEKRPRRTRAERERERRRERDARAERERGTRGEPGHDSRAEQERGTRGERERQARDTRGRTVNQPPNPPRLQPPYDLAPRPPLYPRPDPALSARRPQPAPTRRASKAAVAGRALLGTASAAVLLASAATWAAYHNLTSGLLTSDAINEIRSGEKGYVAPRLDGSVNLLLVGLDSRKDMDGNDLPTDFVEQELHAGSSDIGGYNTNVLILMHIPADGGRVTAFSIARDDYVEEPGGASGVGDIPDLGMHKIKEAYGRAKGIAEQRLKDSGMTDKAQIEKVSREVGRESTIRAVQLLTGEHVDHLAEINLLGFYDIAKAVGPVEVCLNHPVDDPIEDGAGTGLKLPAGHSELDAATALQFVRQRFHLLRGDFDRNRRQQAFLASVLHKLRGEGVVGNLGKMQALFDVVKKDVVIDDSWDVLDFASRAQNLTSGNADFQELPITGQPVLPGDGSVNTVNPWEIRRIVMTAFGDGKDVGPDPAPPSGPGGAPGDGTVPGGGEMPAESATAAGPDSAPSSGSASVGPTAPAAATAPHAAGPPPPAHTVVDVYNATATRGLATSVSDLLTSSGWPVDKTGGAAAQNHTTILYGRGAEAAATQLAEKLGVGALPAPSARAAAGHVVVRIGADYTPPPGTQDGPGGATASPPAAPAISMDDGITCVN